MSDETRDARERSAEAEAHPEPPPAPTTKQPYRKPGLRSGDRLEKTTLASCLTGAHFCGPYGLET